MNLPLDIRRGLRYAHTRLFSMGCRVHAFVNFGYFPDPWRSKEAVSQPESPCTIDCEVVGSPDRCLCLTSDPGSEED